jgi:hypothetical protein
MNTDLATALPASIKRPEMAVWFSQDRLNLSGGSGDSLVKIYNIAGQLVLPAFVITESAPVNLLSGIYIVAIQNKGMLSYKKVIKK